MFLLWIDLFFYGNINETNSLFLTKINSYYVNINNNFDGWVNVYVERCWKFVVIFDGDNFDVFDDYASFFDVYKLIDYDWVDELILLLLLLLLFIWLLWLFLINPLILLAYTLYLSISTTSINILFLMILYTFLTLDYLIDF